MRQLLSALVLAAAVGAAPRAEAGIINVQSILSTEAEEGISGAVTGSVDWRTGNTDLLLLSLAPVARYRLGDELLVLAARGELGRSNGARIIARTFEHGRYRHRFTDLVRGELFAQHEYDEFRRLQLRALGGIGPVFRFLDRDNFSLTVGVAYMLEYEELADDDEIDAGETDLQHRASSYLMADYKLDDRVSLVETVYAQPRLTDPGDFRLLNESQAVVKLKEWLALTTAFTLAWDTEAPATIAALDTRLTSSLTVSF